MRHGADLEAGDREYGTPLDCACWFGQLNVVRFLLRSGANPNAVNTDGETPLHSVCTNNDDNSAEAIRLLLQHGANLEARNAQDLHRTPLHVACYYGSLGAVRELVINHGANLFARDSVEETPLDRARSDDEMAVVEFLLHHYEADLFQRYGPNSVHRLIREETSFLRGDTVSLPIGEVDRTRGLAFLDSLVNRNPAMISTRDENGDTPVHRGCRLGGGIETIRYLVEQDNTALHIPDRSAGQLPIHIACSRTDTDSAVIKLLVERGGAETLGVRDDAGSFQPLHLQLLRRHDQHLSLKKVKYMLKSHLGCVRARTLAGDLPITLACEGSSLDIVFELIRAQPEVVPLPHRKY